MYVRTARSLFAGGHLLGRALIGLDAARVSHALFLLGASRSGLLAALQSPRTVGELVELLDVKNLGLFEAFLGEGTACRELRLRGGRYELRGRRAKALADQIGDSWTALLEEGLAYHSDVYLRLGDRFRGQAPGDYLDHFSEVVARSSRIAEPPIEAFVRWAIRRTKPATVLDIGCGSGIYLRHAADAAPALVGTGIDLAPDAAALARRNVESWGLGSRVRILDGDIRDAPADVGPFDLITLLQNIYYFEPDQRPALLRSIRQRLTARGGLVLVTAVPDNSRISRHFDVVLRSTAGNTALPTPDEVKSQLHAGGFDRVRTRRLIPRGPLFGFLAR